MFFNRLSTNGVSRPRVRRQAAAPPRRGAARQNAGFVRPIEGLETRVLFAIATDFAESVGAAAVAARIAEIETNQGVDLADTGWHTLPVNPTDQTLSVDLFDVDTDDDGIADRFLTGVTVQYGVEAVLEVAGSADLLLASPGSGSSFFFLNLVGDVSITPPTLPDADSPAGALPARDAHVDYTTGVPGIEVEPGESVTFDEFEYDSEPTKDIDPTGGIDALPPGFGYSDLVKLLSFSTFSSGVLEFTETSSGLQQNSFEPNSAGRNRSDFIVAARSYVNIEYEYEPIVRDARIFISPDTDTNGIGEDHTVTALVEFDDGLSDTLPTEVADFYDADTADGFRPAVDADVTVTLTGDGNAVPDISAPSDEPAGDPSSVSGTTDSNGEFSVTFTSLTAGTVIATAVALNVEGFSDLDVDADSTTQLPNTTDPTRPGEDDAEKIFVDGTLRWLKHDQDSVLLGGATFEVVRTHAYNSATDTFDDIPDETTTVADNGPEDDDPTAGEFQLNDLFLGRYTIRETVVPPGYTGDPDTETVELTTANPSNADATGGDVVPIFVNTQENGGGEGLTPGFWKQNATFRSKVTGRIGEAWLDAGFTPPGVSLSTLFTSLAGTQYANLTMLQGLNLGGGGIQALIRHAVAGVLNASHEGIEYDLTVDEIKTAVNAAILGGNATVITDLKDDLDEFNNQGADVDQHGRFTP
jgi:hypothetical protein